MSLMVLGTASHVGKSVTVAAICRWLANRNIQVAPFKSQNMSLNSFVTADGSEIGIAQAMQAYAARLEPCADMNPVLLKPKGDRTSQIVLLGKPYKDVVIGEYYRETGALLAKVAEAYMRLEKQYGTIIVEGAGGAAELNLYDRDIANILLARELKLPIVIVGDIERGGIFAQLIGTYRLLPDDIRPLVVGFIVNKFRGDPALFDDGMRIIEKETGVPVLGVIPFSDIPLPSEDSLSLGDKKRQDAVVRIAVIRLPRISNFTDFELLERHASVEYVQPGSRLDGFDCIIIPGTKNTIDDLRTLRQSGTDREIRRARERGIPVIGICGGFQMLGTEIHDAAGIESSEGGVSSGLGLLEVTTTFDAYRKTTVQVTTRARPVGPILSAMGEVTGYEIHMGETCMDGARAAFDRDGAASEDGLVFGTYLHGLFLNAGAADALLGYLYGQKGLDFTGVDRDSGHFSPGMQGGAPQHYDALADHYDANVDMQYLASRCLARNVGR
ncbi:MAG: cobyric acid synthase [Methanomicrobiales archaeon]|nr:cobyric acid synthase [Methanomicrobiales archaeon]